MSRVSVTAARRLMGATATASLTDEQLAQIITAGYELIGFVLDNLKEIEAHVPRASVAPDNHRTTHQAEGRRPPEDVIDDRVVALVEAGIMSRWDARRLVTQHLVKFQRDDFAV